MGRSGWALATEWHTSTRAGGYWYKGVEGEVEEGRGEAVQFSSDQDRKGKDDPSLQQLNYPLSRMRFHFGSWAATEPGATSIACTVVVLDAAGPGRDWQISRLARLGSLRSQWGGRVARGAKPLTACRVHPRRQL